MAPRKKTATKAKKTAHAAEPKSRAHKKHSPAKKRAATTRAAYAHSPAIAHSAAAPRRAAPAARHDSYKSYSSIMRTVIVFLACVLALAVLANIFYPSFSHRGALGHSSQQDFLDTRNSGYIGGDRDNYGKYNFIDSDSMKASGHSAPAAP